MEADSVVHAELARLQANEPPPWCATSLPRACWPTAWWTALLPGTEGVPLFIQSSPVLRDTSLVETDGVWSFKPGAQVRAIPITLRIAAQPF